MRIRHSLTVMLSLTASLWTTHALALNSEDISASPSQAAPNIPANPMQHDGLKEPSDAGTMPPPPVRDVPLSQDSTVHGHMPPPKDGDMPPPPPRHHGQKPPPPPPEGDGEDDAPPPPAHGHKPPPPPEAKDDDATPHTPPTEKGWVQVPSSNGLPR